MKTIRKSAGIIIKDRKLLVAKSYGKAIYLSPGGKVNGMESNKDTLLRELYEELSILISLADFSYYGQYEAPAATDPSVRVIMNVYMVTHWQGTLKPTSEIEKLAWIDSKNEEHLPVGSIFEHDIVPRLKAENLID